MLGLKYYLANSPKVGSGNSSPGSPWLTQAKDPNVISHLWLSLKDYQRSSFRHLQHVFTMESMNSLKPQMIERKVDFGGR